MYLFFFKEVLLFLFFGMFLNCVKFSFLLMFDCESLVFILVVSIGYFGLIVWIILNEERFIKMMCVCIIYFNLIEVLYDLKVIINSFG